jgi:hypothetical protein
VKTRHFALMVCVLVLASVYLAGCSASPTSSSIVAFNLTGTVTYQGTGSGHVYVFLVNQTNGTVTMGSSLNSGNSYSFNANVVNSEMYAAYDNSGNGFKLSGNTLEQGNGNSLSGSGDVVCLVGYTGACPNVNTTSAQGSFYSTTTGINIVFGGTVTQSGTNCVY